MQKRSTRHGLSAFFFQPPIDGRDAYRVDDPQLDELVGKQRQRPSRAAVRRFTARQLHQTRFGRAIEFRQSRRSFLLLALQRRLQPDEAASLADPFHRPHSDAKLLGDLDVRQSLVRLQQDPRALHLWPRHAAVRGQPAQCGAFILRQIHDVAFHHSDGAWMDRHGKH